MPYMPTLTPFSNTPMLFSYGIKPECLGNVHGVSGKVFLYVFLFFLSFGLAVCLSFCIYFILCLFLSFCLSIFLYFFSFSLSLSLSLCWGFHKTPSL